MPPLRPLPKLDKFLGLAFVAGDKVLDQLTGLEGQVVRGRVEHLTRNAGQAAELSAAAPGFRLPHAVTRQVITVTLEDGSTVERSPEQLFKLPEGLAAPLVDFHPPQT